MTLEILQQFFVVVFCAVLIVVLSAILVMVRRQSKKIADLELKMKAHEAQEKEI